MRATRFGVFVFIHTLLPRDALCLNVFVRINHNIRILRNFSGYTSCRLFGSSDKQVMSEYTTSDEEQPPPKKPTKKPEEGLDEDEYPRPLDWYRYKFNEEGRLRHIDDGKPFVFNFYENDDQKNQKRYERIGEAITRRIYELLVSDMKLEKIEVPVDAKYNFCEKPTEPVSFIFASKDALTNTDKLMLLIHGSGVVRAGQWARRLIINDCLDSGTQFPFIRKAQEEGYGVIVLNTNLNWDYYEGKKVHIRGSESPQEHTKYVWEKFVRKAKAKHIAIIAHSFGGVCVMDLVKSHGEEMKEKNRVFAIAFTDSVHHMEMQEVPKPASEWLFEIARNWVTNQKPLDTEVQSYGRTDVPKVSAGTLVHEMTSWKSMGSIFQFLNERLAKGKKTPLRSDL